MDQMHEEAAGCEIFAALGVMFAIIVLLEGWAAVVLPAIFVGILAAAFGLWALAALARRAFGGKR